MGSVKKSVREKIIARATARVSDVAWRAGIDAGPRQRLQHDAVSLEAMPREDGAGLRARVSTQRPLDRYALRGEISVPQFQAGERLRADFERAGLQPRVIMHYAPRLPASKAEARDSTMDARRRLYAAIDRVGRLGEGVLWAVCCVGESAGDWAHRHGRGVRDGIVLLRAALDELDRHYNPPSPRRPGADLVRADSPAIASNRDRSSDDATAAARRWPAASARGVARR